jgi:hypothetical protein
MKVHKVLLFPLQSGQHWSLLVLVVEGLLLFAVDSGKGKIFGHSDMQYGSFIGVLEQVLKLDPHTITCSPTHLPCTIQPNGFDCGYHAVINACSISEHIDASDGGGIDLTKWDSPTSTPTEVREFRKELYNRAAVLPYAAVPPADDGSGSDDGLDDDNDDDDDDVDSDEEFLNPKTS